MKEKILLFCFLVIYNSISQTKKTLKETTTQIKKYKMEYFDIELYKDWEIDNFHSQSEDDRFLKKGNERMEIWFYENKIQVERSSLLNPYKRTSIYFRKTKVLYTHVTEFYQFSIRIDKTYDETGKVINEKDNDKPYVFSLRQLIEKIKREYNVDLEDRTQKGLVDRRIDAYLKKPIYELDLPSEKAPDFVTDYLLIDGITGEILFKTTYNNMDDSLTTPYYQYLELLKNKETEDNSYYKSYKGKDYTKKEWEAFEEEWFRDYEERKKGGNFFLDNIFKKNR